MYFRGQMSKRFFIYFLLFASPILLLLYSFQVETITKEKIGEMLFFEKTLSSDSSISCASCHKPEFAFADHVAFSKGVGGHLTKRNTPSVMNMAARSVFFWDGRAASLEEQVKGPIENPDEMNLPFAKAVHRLRQNTRYIPLFRQVFHRMPDSASVLECIAAFERSLETDQTPSDRWLNDLPGGLNEAQIRGRELFLSERTRCFDCHFTPDFTADEFRNIGLFNGKDLNDSGRYCISHKQEDIGKFKVPGLRNIAQTAPYMHNGQFKTLKEVVDYYNDPESVLKGGLFRDEILPAKMGLTESEKLDLVDYLEALSDDRFTRKK